MSNLTSHNTGDMGPVGSGKYVVKIGECINSIAYENGLFWETIWFDQSNIKLREARKDPGLILAGDKLTIPEKQLGNESRATESKHRFRLKGVPAKLKLRFLYEEPSEHEDDPVEGPDTNALNVESEDPDPPEPAEPVPRANVPYQLYIEGILSQGTTNSEGELELTIPPNARRGKIILEPGTVRETDFPLQLGRLDPVSELCGVKQRLNNLGFPAGEENAEFTEQCQTAISEFQAANGLEANGLLDDTTRSKIEEVHGS